jgi:hypothetical protein
MAGHGRAVVRGTDPGPAAPGEFASRADLIGKITDFTVRYNRTARPWTWTYDARADHAQYRARHTGQHLAEPLDAQALPQAA